MSNRKTIYNPPQLETPRVARYPAVISITVSILMVVFAGILLVSKMLPWYANIFVILVVISNVAIVLWLVKLNIIRQHEIDEKYRERYIRLNRKWIINTVIPQINQATSLNLAFDDAAQLTYEGTLVKQLNIPYENGQYTLYFAIDERRNPIITIRQMMDSFDSTSPHTELIANIPLHKRRKPFLKR